MFKFDFELLKNVSFGQKLKHHGVEIAHLFQNTTGNMIYVRTLHVADCTGMYQ
jgi:hypothetical protein